MNYNLPPLLPVSPIAIVRSTNNHNFRERTTHEKYYTQNITIFDQHGKLVDSGFIQVNDYTNMCRMVKVLDKNKTYIHACKKIEHYDSQTFVTEYYTLYDLLTNKIIGTIHRDIIGTHTLTQIIKNIDNDATLFVDDLIPDHLSKAILDIINSIHRDNNPNKIIQDSRYSFTHNDDNDDNDDTEQHTVCDCRMFDVIDINHSLQHQHIDAQQHKRLLRKLECVCTPIYTLPDISQQLKHDIHTQARDIVYQKLKILHGFTF